MTHTPNLKYVQFMIKIFNLELKYDDPLVLAYEIRVIVHNIEATRFKIDVLLTNFVKEIYPTYSIYLESL